MRRRSTFVHDPSLDVDPRQLYVSGDRLVIENLRAAREERLTLGFNELPEELWQVLSQSHELHIRWASEYPYHAIPPFVSKTSPGLHLFYTPLQGQSGDLLCPLLHKVFSSTLKCKSPLRTFTTPHLRSGRFASTSSLQYHALLPSLNHLISYIQRHLCKRSDQHCIHSASLLNIANTVDIDYDSISHTVTLTARWSRPPAILYDPSTNNITENAWSLDIHSPPNADKVEVGILSNELPTDPSEINLSGFLTIVGEDDHPKPTLFSFPSRHHALPASQSHDQKYTISFLRPTGLHPVMQISFPHASALHPPTNKPTPEAVCALHTYLTLPSALFADKYQLATTTDRVFLHSHHLRALRSISGETDLEAPDYMMEKWGSNVLLELATPSTSTSQRPPFLLLLHSDPLPVADSTSTTATTTTTTTAWNITIPLHLRYLAPAPTGYTEIQLPSPILFWACTADEGSKFPVNPFDRVDLGFEALFGPRTAFYFLEPAPPALAEAEQEEEEEVVGVGGGRGKGGGGGGERGRGRGRGRLVETLQVPVLGTEGWVGVEAVEWGTVAVVVLGFLWVGWNLLGRNSTTGGRGARKRVQVKKKR